jgi:hypothetical protein
MEREVKLLHLPGFFIHYEIGPSGGSDSRRSMVYFMQNENYMTETFKGIVNMDIRDSKPD